MSFSERAFGVPQTKSQISTENIFVRKIHKTLIKDTFCCGFLVRLECNELKNCNKSQNNSLTTAVTGYFQSNSPNLVH